MFVRRAVCTQHEGTARATDGKTDLERQGSERAATHTHHPDSGPAEEQCRRSEWYKQTQRRTDTQTHTHLGAECSIFMKITVHKLAVVRCGDLTSAA